MATVDVIIPFYNTPLLFVEQALASLRAQTFTDWHACLVNDGSDAAVSLALEGLLTELNDPRIAYRRVSNGGAAAARNIGLEATSSPYITLLDADDCYHSHMLEAHVALLEGRADVDVVYADHEVIDRQGNVTQAAADIAVIARRHEMNTLATNSCSNRWPNAISWRALP